MIPLLRSVLRRSYDGHSWHGPSLADVLDGVDARTALARPVAGAHSIWELTHHLMAWTREVTRRLAGQPATMPREGDWPDAPELAAGDVEARWRAVRDELTVARGALLAAVEAFPPARLNDRVGTSDDAAIGGQATFAGMLVGLAEHNAYHGGQITVLRRALQ
ncbi:MAG: DinB family protein [Gemmatirosa sp.]